MSQTIYIAEVGDLARCNLANVLTSLPAWRQKMVLRYHNSSDRVLCAAAFLLLKHALKKELDIDSELNFDYTSTGKPTLREYPDIHFNLSHCKKRVACAIDTHPVGIDIEEITLPERNVLEYCCNRKELESIHSANNPSLAFTQIWTRKESYLKMLGSGMQNNMREIEGLENASFTEIANPEKGYVCTVCSETNQRKVYEMPIESLFS